MSPAPPSKVPTVTIEREQPRTEAGRELARYLDEIADLVGRRYDPADILAIEAEAAAPLEARVRELEAALRWAVPFIDTLPPQYLELIGDQDGLIAARAALKGADHE